MVTLPATGFIGLGAMGAPMAANLNRAGVLAAVWNRTPAKAQSVAAELAVAVAASPAALARQVDVVVLCVSADADVLAVIEALEPGLRPGQVVIDHSTVQPQTAQTAAARLAARGVDFLDAPVSGGVEGARRGTLALMVGGEAGVLERVRPLLQALGQRIEHMGPVGSGQATKAVNQIMAAGINQAVTEALAFAEAHALPLEQVIEVVGAGAAGNWFLSHRGPSMTQGRFEPGFRLGLHHKDLAICRAMAEALGMELPLVNRTLADYRQLMQDGFGDEDISALYRMKRRPSKHGD
ncbi:tartronate semialdehyde reductase [Thiohalobacter sp. COW1]|uniref:NAD(P)-dependent oxidoreductase n=1 Tax=Thiohalobacter sp. COW1 TaxID=2795687 RepID=UPI00193538F0|nr:NAD(P)-dependent oxidoreductase [Thiohalobacter sp. COW1]BCO32515.1 tartronate semialdehyde reductase [Thiohalobacter sp. COW1]